MGEYLISRVFISLLCLKVVIHSIVCTEFYADNGLRQTVLIGESDQRRQTRVQLEILELLGLHQRPRSVKHGYDNSAPRYMIDLYNSLKANEGEDDESADDDKFHTTVNLTIGQSIELSSTDVIRSFINHANKIPHLRHDKDSTMFFDTSDVAPTESVIVAELRLYKEPKKSKDAECLIEVFRIQQGDDPEDKQLVPESNTTVQVDFEGWVNINVTNAVNQWMFDPLSNLGLYIRVTRLTNDRVIEPGKIGLVGRRGPDEKQAFMVGFFKNSQVVNVRNRRSVDEASNTPNDAENYYNWGGGSYSMEHYRRSACQRRTLYVSFRSLGWQDWIIAPEGYSAFYCGGECTFPLGAHMNATNHAIVQTLVHMTKSAVPKPCCAPTKLSPIQVLYFDDKSNVVLKRYKNMKVKACGCH